MRVHINMHMQQHAHQLEQYYGKGHIFDVALICDNIIKLFFHLWKVVKKMADCGHLQ